MADDDYQYDVFFSYRRDPLIQDWIMEVVTRLRFRLTQDLARWRTGAHFLGPGYRVGRYLARETARRSSEIQMSGGYLVTQLLPIGVVLVRMAEFPGTRETVRRSIALDRAD
jgi:hypothetical protein